MDANEDISTILTATSRYERYRLAGKTMRYHVYQAIEVLVALLFVLLVALVWIEAATPLLAGISVLAIILSLLHHATAALLKPWLAMAAAFEATLVWYVYHQWFSGFFEIPFFSAFCVFVFTVRYWQRGEREVRLAALAALRGMESSTNAMRLTP